ncbi:MAG TPA: 5-oxoprolinase subunit PxpA [Intrasporangium sp.]|uniref:LamB/YcsF family protein n=1 Tax=Intrasporangium sp. TaxID=1925024 RepID=UPI002B4A167B|nr:5-oxoprolinase subunit PxpA [Intrasporangium sp.]HKX67331.1 5-oxoprolinase subunit PxpA [Intrasporangium sp.]
MTTGQRIDLNSDLGESLGIWAVGNDAAMLDIVTSANVACGFHAGDSLTLQRTCAQAAERGVVVGAQVGYRDLAGFGRRFIDMDADELTADVIYQIGALEAMCRVAGTRVEYVKPHGALYNAIVDHETQATAVVAAVAAVDPSLPVVGLPGSAFLRIAADAGLRTVSEAFADRAYTPEGHLLPRREAGSVLHDPGEVAARMVRLAVEGRITAIDGTELEVRADSICTHGDSPGAVDIARALRAALTGAGVEIAPFTR